MNLKLKTDKKDYPVFGFSMSLILHALIFTSAAIIMNSSIEEAIVVSPYIQISMMESRFELQSYRPEKERRNEKQEVTENAAVSKESKEIPDRESVQNSSESLFSDFSENPGDTSELNQIYKENTLDVSLKYPSGWMYIDQNVKNMLDGVTFWTTSAGYNPPPYVHIEVHDKDIFNPKRFQHRYKTRNYTAYYNDPEALEGQIAQIIYIRTNIEKDFSLKLIMKGEEAFRRFQPVFFGMVKSFKYGNRFF